MSTKKRPSFKNKQIASSRPHTADMPNRDKPKNMGRAAVRFMPDGWTVVTADRKHSAHYENTVAITAGGPIILTAE